MIILRIFVLLKKHKIQLLCLKVGKINTNILSVISIPRHEIDVHEMKYNECTASDEDEFGYYNCQAGCGYVFSTKTTRNRYKEMI